MIPRRRSSIVIPLAIFGVVCLSVVAVGQFTLRPAISQTPTYPRLANYFLKTPISDAEVTQLAKWDVIVLGMQAQTVSPEQIRKIRQFNPAVTILAYVAAQEFPGHYQEIENSDGLWHRLRAGIDERWWLLRPDGSRFSSWPNNWSLNVSDYAPTNSRGERWNTYLPRFMKEEVMSSGLWDGIFYDNVWDTAHWVGDGNMDINRDGTRDSGELIDAAWSGGMDVMLKESRRLEGNDAIILGNGPTKYQDSLNGRLLENAYRIGWVYDQQQYTNLMRAGRDPRVTIISQNTNNTGSYTNYPWVRFGLTSTLLQNGYYGFDWGDQDHSQLWWYDEYNVELGRPTGGSCRLVIDSAGTVTGCQSSDQLTMGVWRRDFDRGTVLVNSNPTTTTFYFPTEELEKIRGSQDPAVNDGSRVNVIRLAPQDGLVLYRPLTDIRSAAFVNGSFARVFTATGAIQRSGFYAAKSIAPANTQVMTVDLDSDSEVETLVADTSTIALYRADGSLARRWYPYAATYNRGINIAVGDLNGDGTKEIVTGTANGGGPHIRVFNNRGDLINPGFFAYGAGYRGGVNVAVGDLNGDGTDEIVAGAGSGGGPHLRIFDRNGRLLSAGWFAYDEKFRGGVRVAVGDLNGDGRAEIISIPGPGRSAEVKIWDDHGRQQGASWLAFDAANRGGGQIAAVDMDGDGGLEIVAMSLNVF
ncbi:MAG: putative glycoside hydrolase [Patescibacteria group bacterium]